MLSTGAQPYFVTSTPTVWPISVSDFKAWAKVTGSADDTLIASIIKRVTEQAELYTKREFITKSFVTYRDIFGGIDGYTYYGYPLEIRRSKLQAITTIKYYLDDVLTTLNSSNYYIVKKADFSLIASVGNELWPLVDDRYQAVEITFTAGYGPAATDVPEAIRNALLAHATAVYENRGDCDADGNSAGCSCNFAPSIAKSVYNQFKIIDFIG